MIIADKIYSTVANKCPRCHSGKMFENNNPYNLSNGLKMKESCDHCHLTYEREPGFFFGAMYVSYALFAGLFILWFVADALWFHLDSIILVTLVAASMLILVPVSFRWARSLWINFFVSFDKTYKKPSNINDNRKIISINK